MKKISIILFLSMALYANAQTINPGKVPAAVKAAFFKIHPSTNRVTWELENAIYEGGFTLDGKKMSEIYSKTGQLLETEKEVPFGLLPSGVLLYIKKQYKGAKVKESAKITKRDGSVNYEAAIQGRDLIFDSKGNFLKEVKD